MDNTTQVIRIVVDSSRAVDGSAAATRAWERMERSQNAAASSLARMETVLRSVGALLVGTVGVRAILDAADAFTRFQNSLRVAGVQGEAMAQVQTRLFAAANKNGVEIGALAQLYSRASIAAGELGATQEQLLKFVDGVTAALRLQGGSTQSASGALLQLSQALGAGIVRAEEFNSILEGAFPIAQAAARGIDGMGGSVSKLRTAIASGQVTSQRFFEGLLKGLSATEAQAAGMSLTVGQALTVLDNSFTHLVGTFDQSTGATSLLSSAIVAIGRGMDVASAAIETLSANLGDIAEGAAIAGTALAVAFAPTVLAAMANGFVALGVAGIAAIRGITAAMLANPLGALAVGITAAVSAIYYFRDEIKQALGVDVVEVAKNVANVVIGSFVAAYNDIGYVWENFPDILGDAATRAGNRMIEGIEAAINFLIPKIKEFYRIINPIARLADTIGGSTSDVLGTGIVPDSISIPRIENTAGGRLAGPQASRDAARRAELSRDYIGDLGDALRRAGGAGGGGGGGGAGGAGAGGGGGKAAENAAAKYEKLMRQLTATAEAQDAMTAAARNGEQALDDQKVHLDAVQKSMEIFGKRLDDNDPKLQALEQVMRRISEGKAAEAFATATTNLERQNEVLETQIALIGEAPEIRARELAIIKAKQEAEKAGTAITADDIARRIEATEINERLKAQQKEIQKAQELWTEPLKQALRDIQTTAADAFFEILDSGKFSFQSLADTFSKIVKRMAAEFLALATIRPVMSVVVNAISPSIEREMGLGGGGSGGGGGLLDSIFGGGGSSGFFSRPIGSLFPSSVPAGGFSDVGALLASGRTGASASAAGMSGLGGISIGQGLGAIAGAGMGIYNLANSKSTGQTIGGIASLIGAGVSLIPGIGQIAGPIISILGGLAGGLFGGTPAPVNSYGIAGLTYNGSGFATAGGAYGANGSQPSFGNLGAGMSAIYDLFGGVQDASRVYGLSLQSFNQQYANGEAFNNQTSFIVGPNGQRRQWGMGSTEQDVGLAAAAAEAVLSSILEGAVGDISSNMRTALEQIDQAGGATLETIGQAVAAIQSFDAALENVGKTTSDVEQAFNAIDEQFASLFATAAEYGLPTGGLTNAVWQARSKVVTDFATDLRLSTLDITDPRQAALERLDKERQDLIANNDAIVEMYGQSMSQIAQIEQFYAEKRKQIIKQFAEDSTQAVEQAVAAATSSIGSLQDLIRQLSPGGDLANLDPSGQYAGLKATYQASVAQARANPTDAALIERAVSDAEVFAEFSRSYFGGSTAYSADHDTILREAQQLQLASARGGVAASGSDTQLVMLFQQLASAITTATNSNSATSLAKVDRMIELLTRYVANGKKAA